MMEGVGTVIQKIRNRFQVLRKSSTGLTALAGYAAMLSAMVVGVFTVPMALRFLSPEEFGLWNIVGQSLGYLLLLDLGVSWSASRMLVGPLRAGDRDETGAWWTVLLTVLIVQALLILALGWACRPWIISFFDVPPALRETAEWLWMGMLLINCVQLPFRALSAVLFCQDRWYLMHSVSIVASWLNLLVFAALLLAGWRTSAYVAASALSVGASIGLWWYAVRRSRVALPFDLKLLRRDYLRRLFGYSSSLFIVGLAGQLTLMSQSIVIGKILGLGAVAAFVVSSKSAAILIQIYRRGLDAYYPRWMQIYTDGDPGEVCRQWRNSMNWLLPLSVAGAIGVLVLNRSFSLLYGGAGNHEGRTFDLLLACGLLVQVFVQSMYFVFPLSSRVRAWAIAGLADAAVQIAAGIVFTRWFGACGLLIGGILGSALVSVPFMILRAPAELGVSRRLMLAGFGKWFATGAVCLGACYGVLMFQTGAVNESWKPSPVELGLMLALAAASAAFVIGRRQWTGHVTGASA